MGVHCPVHKSSWSFDLGVFSIVKDVKKTYLRCRFLGPSSTWRLILYLPACSPRLQPPALLPPHPRQPRLRPRHASPNYDHFWLHLNLAMLGVITHSLDLCVELGDIGALARFLNKEYLDLE